MFQIDILDLEDVANVTLNSFRSMLVIIYRVRRSAFEQSTNDPRCPIEQVLIDIRVIKR